MELAIDASRYRRNPEEQGCSYIYTDRTDGIRNMLQRATARYLEAGGMAVSRRFLALKNIIYHECNETQPSAVMLTDILYEFSFQIDLH